MTDPEEPRDAIKSIEIRGLVKTYPGVVALDGADVSIPGANVLGLLGKNGAGKSTLIKVLAGAVQPDSGEVLVDGEPIGIHDPHAAAGLGFAFVHQELADVPNLSVAENVLLGLGYPKRVREPGADPGDAQAGAHRARAPGGRHRSRRAAVQPEHRPAPARDDRARHRGRRAPVRARRADRLADRRARSTTSIACCARCATMASRSST